ncbi:MAG: MarR family transcriptional regulator [Eubacteriales bacterium]|nr:MarR family transcriptional regulator [Eubacteriales bacterium]
MERGVGALRDLFRTVARDLGLFDKSEATCCGVTTAQSRTLLELGYSGSVSLIELAEQLGVDKSTMSRTVDRLVHARLAERKQGAENRRYVKVRLTERGEAIFQDLDGKLSRYYGSILNAIPAEKRGQVEESVLLITAAIEHTTCCGQYD